MKIFCINSLFIHFEIVCFNQTTNNIFDAKFYRLVNLVNKANLWLALCMLKFSAKIRLD